MTGLDTLSVDVVEAWSRVKALGGQASKSNEWLPAILHLGKLLTEVKKKIGLHGWKKWFKTNCGGIAEHDLGYLIVIAEAPSMAKVLFDEGYSNLKIGKRTLKNGARCRSFQSLGLGIYSLRKLGGPTSKPRDQKDVMRNRVDRVKSIFTNLKTRTAISNASKSRGGNEILTIIEQAKENGFLTEKNSFAIPRKSNTLPLQILFSNADVEFGRFDLKNKDVRTWVQNVLMPLAIEHREEVKSNPSFLINEIARYGHAHTKRQRDHHGVANPNNAMPENQIMMYGEVFWPNQNVTYKQCRSVCLFFKRILPLCGSDKDETIVVLRGFAKDLAGFTDKTCSGLFLSMVDAWGQNPDGLCDPSPQLSDCL